jgi:serine/threonine-protein kinase
MPTVGPAPLPSQFGRYTLLERLAIGGMAEVFRAKIVSSHGFEKILVIKRILPHLAADATFVSMFIDEAKLTAQLTHPKIVQILDFGDVAGQYFIALEFIDGFDALGLLRVSAQRRVKIPFPLAAFITGEVLEALDYAHNARDMDGKPMHIVHRDISPSNIFISKRGDVKLGDFGIAHARRRESKTQAGTLKGKYGYMSPEQVVGQAIDGRSDLFAVGVVLAEMLMGRRLFTAPNDLDVLLMVRDARTERLDKYCQDLPPVLDRIVRRALKKDVRERYASAAEFRDELSDYMFETGHRIGPTDLRAFVGELFGGSPDAGAKLMQQSRKANEPGRRGTATAKPADPEQHNREVVGGTGVAATAIAGTGAMAAAAMRSANTSTVVAVEEADIADEVVLGPGGSAAVTEPRRAPARPIPLEALADAPTTAAPTVAAAIDAGYGEREQSSVHGTGWTPISKVGMMRPDQGSGARRTFQTGTRSEVGRFVSSAPKRPPDSAGDVSVITPMRLLCDLAVAGETGLLRFELTPAVKEIFVVNGAPESINSSLPNERFGEYLVARGILSAADLDGALGMLPQYAGKLGDTLVGLGLLRPLDVFRLLSQQVRDRVIDVFTWTEGTFAFYRGVTNAHDSFPLGLDPFEILGAGVVTIPQPGLEQRFAPMMDQRPVATGTARVQPDAFRLGPTPREVLDMLSGEHTLRAWTAHFAEPTERITFLRTLYLLVETDLVQFD